MGLVVNSLEEVASLVEAMEESEYREYVAYVEQFAPALRKGFYTKKCLINAIQAFYKQDARSVWIPEEPYSLEDCKFTSTVLNESYGGNLALS